MSMFQEFGITLDLEEVFKRFKGVKLYEIIDIINEEHGVNLAKADLEPVYRAEVARLFDSELEVIAGQRAAGCDDVPCAWSLTARSAKCSTRWASRHVAPFPGKTVQRLRYSALEARSGTDVPCGKGDER
jgi:hypothetical protein